jgi:transcriptional regulator with XRE-family HTH domain
MAVSQEIEELLAAKLRSARRKRGLTLNEFSKKCGISVSMLSKIENAKVSPPIATYSIISKTLGISLGELIHESETNSICLVKKNERKKYTQSPGYTGESIAFKKADKKMEPFIFTYSPRNDHPSPYQHNNEEFIFVLSGILEFRYGEEIFILEPGDCVYFNATIKHSARALNENTAQALVVESS